LGKAYTYLRSPGALGHYGKIRSGRSLAEFWR